MEISKSNDNTHRNKERDRVRGIHGKPWQEIKKFVNYGKKNLHFDFGFSSKAEIKR